MTEDERDDLIVRDIRAMAIARQDVPSLLRHVQQSLGQKDCKLLSAIYFHRAFGSDIPSISPVAGWHGFGGELSDAQVNEWVSPVLEEFRRVTKR